MLISAALAIVALFQLRLTNADQSKLRFVPNVPEECQRLGYCNQALPDYPEEHVAKLIKAFGLQSVNQTVVDKINPTRGQDPQDVELCAYLQEELIPSVAQDTNGTWNFIINSKLLYTQKYLVEICNKADVPCAPVAHFPPGYHASCQQNFITKLLLALDHTGNKVEKRFRIPSNCYCKVKASDRGPMNTEDDKKLYNKMESFAMKYHRISKGWARH